ncbi:MAG: M23 family metallopeptidase [Bacteroidota bacterium]
MQKVAKTALLVIFLAGFLIPDKTKMPVQGASKSDYHPDSFWYYPWGKSVTHKGIDIFAKKNTPIHSASKGWVIYTGEINMGGKIILILGTKWRFHYYAHLESINIKAFSQVNQETNIGTVGDSGNAKGKPPHLHYTILTLIPYPWRIDDSPQGWKKIFYLDPSSFF